jgi:hypothetical protein
MMVRRWEVAVASYTNDAHSFKGPFLTRWRAQALADLGNRCTRGLYGINYFVRRRKA